MMSDDFFEMMKLIIQCHNFPIKEVMGENFVEVKEHTADPTGQKKDGGKSNGDGTGE